MKVIDVVQGSPEWKKLRADHHTASEASAMMGASKKTSRDELLRMKATGDEKEFSDWVQKNLLDKGHEIEAKARPIAEAIVGEELFPATAVDDDDYLLSSYDGITMLEDIGWECKSWNEAKAAEVREGRVPEEDYWQVIQQLVVGVNRVLYMVTDGTEEKTVHVWKELTDSERKKLLAGWEQFEKDLAEYEYTPEPEVVQADVVKSLPAVTIKAEGSIKLIDNLDVFGAALEKYVDNIPSEPENDQDFANLEAAVKVLQDAENALTSAENNALAQAESIDEMRRNVDMYRTIARNARLAADKLVKNQKEVIKKRVADEAKAALNAHVKQLNEGLGGNYMPAIETDFRAAGKGKRTISTFKSAINDELARAKIYSNEVAETIRANLKAISAAGDYMFLFRDLDSIITKAPDDFKLLVDARVNEHKAAEEARLEAERERIRQEEQQRIANEEAQRAEQEAARLADEAREETKEEAPEPEGTATSSYAENHDNDGRRVTRKAPQQMSSMDMAYTNAVESFCLNGYEEDEAKKIVGLISMGYIENVSLNAASEERRAASA